MKLDDKSTAAATLPLRARASVSNLTMISLDSDIPIEGRRVEDADHPISRRPKAAAEGERLGHVGQPCDSARGGEKGSGVALNSAATPRRIRSNSASSLLRRLTESQLSSLARQKKRLKARSYQQVAAHLTEALVALQRRLYP